MMNDDTLSPVAENAKTGVTMNVLKYIAIVAMFIDHAAHAFVPENTVLYVVLRFIGRITGPVMFFAASEGCRHTKNINRYMLRLALFALVSYFPFMYFDSAGSLARLDFTELNVIYTIFLGVAAVRIRKELKNPVVKILLILGLIALSIPADWGVTGILIILTFDYFYGNFKHQAFGYSLIVLLNVGVINLIIQPVSQLLYYRSIQIDTATYKYHIIPAGTLVPLILLYFYNRQRGSGSWFSKWFFYIFYPLHLLLLGLLQRVLL